MFGVRHRPAAFLAGLAALGALSTILFAAAGGCGNQNDPNYWLEKMGDVAWRDQVLLNVQRLYSEKLKMANSDHNNPDVQAYVKSVGQELVKAYEGMTKVNPPDTASMSKIVSILSEMDSPDAMPVYLHALGDAEGVAKMTRATTAVQAVRRFCTGSDPNAELIPPPSKRDAAWQTKCASAMPAVAPMVKLYYDINAARASRGENAENTAEEDALAMGVISAVGNIVLGNPSLPQRDPAVDMLVKALETSDIGQDLRINMDALKLLGAIGEPRVIPTLVKALFIQGKRRQVALQEVARLAIMQSDDLGAMADAMVQAGRMQNEGLNQMQQDDPNFDVRLIKEQVAITLGMMGIRSDSVTSYLMEELTREEFDAVDEQPGRGGGSFTKERSRSVRRSFAAQALGKLRHEPALETILGRLRAKKSTEGWAPEDKLVDFEEWPGYLDAAGDYVEPTKTDEAMLPFLVFGDDALLDRTGRRLSLQSSSSKVLAEVTKKFGELGPCEEGVKGCVRTNYEKRYIPLIKSGEGCATVDCNAPRLADKASYVRERAAYQLILAAQDDESQQAAARDALIKAMVVEENDDVLSGLIFAMDRLSPRGCDQACLTRLDDRVAELLASASGNVARRSLASLRGRLAYRARTAQ
jgi:hypothetical protein